MIIRLWNLSFPIPLANIVFYSLSRKRNPHISYYFVELNANLSLSVTISNYQLSRRHSSSASSFGVMVSFSKENKAI